MQTDPTDVGGKRVVATIIDWGIWVVINSVLFYTLAESADTGGLFGCSDLNTSWNNQCVALGDKIYVVEDSNGTLLNLIMLAYAIGIFVIMRGLTGKTPGTMLMGIRCVDEQGQPIGIAKGFVRSIAGVVDYIPCCFPLVGLITMFTTKGHRRVGDMAAKSFMIDDAYAGQPIVIQGLTAPAQTAYSTPAAAPGGDAQWDAQRNAWIRWDAAQGAWLQWSDQTQSWTSIQS